MTLNKKHSLRCCLVLWTLILSTLLTSLPLTAFPVFSVESTSKDETTPSVDLTLGGEKISALELSQHGKSPIVARAEGIEKPAYQWQILDKTDSKRWIDIENAVTGTLFVSYALVSSMLDQSGSSAVRCVVSDGENTYESASLSVTVSFDTYEYVSPYYEPSAILQTPPSLYAAEDELSTYTIVINYLFDNGAIAFEPYGASVAKGSAFSATITSPTVVGYAPFRRIGEDYVDASKVTLEYANISSNITINVIYEPALVDFSVHHHLQNLENDEYSIHYDLITKAQALTGSQVPDGLALNSAQLPGFSSLDYERLTVAADGSTVVEIRYDRNYYLVDFDMAGGYGVEPVYTKYGSSVGANIPTKHGYVFDGWELVSYGGEVPTNEQKSQYDINSGNVISVPDANLKYRARWITAQTEYTMVFWKENANDSGYTYWGYLDGISALSGSYVSGADRISEVSGIDDEVYFTFNSEKTEKNVLVEGDGSTVVNVYYTRNYYTLTIKAPGKCTIKENHTHTDSCYDVICGLGHVHTDECLPELICPTPEHTSHTDDCIICGNSEHTHGSACCNVPQHTHVFECWSNVGNRANPKNAPSDPENGQIYRRSNSYYIYVLGSWYNYTGWGASNGDVVDPSCGYEADHVHSDSCCPLPEHTHSDSCYRDIIHTHEDYCYRYSCGDPEHIHSDKCYRLICEITANHSHSSTCTRATSTNTVKTVRRKYEQSIKDIWPITDGNGKTYDKGERWKPSSSSYYTEVLVYIATMTADDFTLTLDEASHTPYIMNYWLEVLPGEPYEKEYKNKYYVLDNTIKAQYNYVTKAEDFFNIAGFVQNQSDPAFSSGQIDMNSGDMTVDFYYTRITDHYLHFNNNGAVIPDKSEYGIMFGANIPQYNFTPDYPSNLEPNAYTFGGWYTSPGCYDGTEVDWNTITMPVGDLLLYAKWSPVKHTVRVFKDATLSEQVSPDQLVDHGSFAYAPQSHPVNGNYVFQGWFYIDEDEGNKEKAFVFNGIPVVHDLDIYAKWSSHVTVSYSIHYKLRGSDTPVADPTLGSAIAGHNKTFDAKAGSDLYSAYQSGYFPLTNSHTITMSVDGTHEFTFEYVYVESMPYTVRYVDALTGAEIFESKTITDNHLSVVTETFVKKDKMMPDAYQKRLVLSAEGTDADGDGVLDNNVITFYYTHDEEHSFYKVVHYIQAIGGDSYREYRSEEAMGIIGNPYYFSALSLDGFSFNGALTKINGVVSPSSANISQTLGEDGLLIELYYDRITVKYTVIYTDSTGKEISPSKSGVGIYGAQVTEYARNLASLGYTLVSENLKILNLSANQEHNVIEFVYQEATVSIKYQIVGPEGCGSLTQYSENVHAITGVPNGSLPTASNGYIFVGWFTNAACTEEADSSLIDASTGKLTPRKENGEVWASDLTYYAKFISKSTDLTVKTSGCSDSDANQTFIFRIKGVIGTETQSIDLTVAITGNGSVTVTELPVGSYTVTQLTDWSWRYDTATPQSSITLSVNKEINVVTYVNSRVQDKWLDGEDVKDNLFSDYQG